MKIGIGIPHHRDVLQSMGVEAIIETHRLNSILGDGVGFVTFRPGDVIVLPQPNLLTLKQLKAMADQGAMFQVPGYDPVPAANDEARRILRQLKPKGVDLVRKDDRGAKPKYPQPTQEQVAAIVALWHSGVKRAKLVEQVQNMMGAEVKDSWVRDQVIKATGSARRKPSNK